METLYTVLAGMLAVVAVIIAVSGAVLIGAVIIAALVGLWNFWHM